MNSPAHWPRVAAYNAQEFEGMHPLVRSGPLRNNKVSYTKLDVSSILTRQVVKYDELR